jgi:hypothetical protein
MNDIYREFGVDVLRDSENAGPSAAEMKMAQEITRLRASVEVLEETLIDARHNGLIYWSPMTERGAVERAAMMARIDKVLNKEAKP